MRKDQTKTPAPGSLEPVGSGTDDEIWKRAKREHDAAGRILNALRPVSQNERGRILNYFWDKYVVHPVSILLPPEHAPVLSPGLFFSPTHTDWR
jgi:hypothetical protein